MGYKDVDAQRAYQARWMAKRREDWINSQGGKCVQCGSDDRLEVDHKDRSTKEYRPAHIWSRKAEDREKELAKCQVLCYTCHKKKTRSEIRVTTHGTGSLYRRGCRCRVCKDGNAAAKRRWRASKKTTTE